MTDHAPTDAPEDEQPDDDAVQQDAVTRADFKSEAEPEQEPETVTLTGPGGVVISTTEDNAENMRRQGFS